jgi:formylmethanofuran dehydrogenase subunit E
VTKTTVTLLISLFFTFACQPNKKLKVNVIDTDFSKGRLTYTQQIQYIDLVKFHGHLCDGLVMGSLALEYGLTTLYPNEPIDRTNLRIVSKSSPCISDAAIYLTGARYQYNSFYIDSAMSSIYILQRLDNLTSISIQLKDGVKPSIIDSLGNLAIQQKLSPCGIDSLRRLEIQFKNYLYMTKSTDLFTLDTLKNFEWRPDFTKSYQKTDIINKQKDKCYSK